MSKVEDCELAMYNAKKAARAEVNLFCEIVGLPKNDYNDFIADDPHGVVDFQEGYMFFSMSDIHVVIAEYEHWLELYKTNEEIARVVREWYYWSLDWREKHRPMEWNDASTSLPEAMKNVLVCEDYGDHDIYHVACYNDIHGTGHGFWQTSDCSIIEDGVYKWAAIIPADDTHYCNLKSWLMGWRPDPKDVLPQYKEHQAKELTAAHARVEVSKEELRKAMEFMDCVSF